MEKVEQITTTSTRGHEQRLLQYVNVEDISLADNRDIERRLKRT